MHKRNSLLLAMAAVLVAGAVAPGYEVRITPTLETALATERAGLTMADSIANERLLEIRAGGSQEAGERLRKSSARRPRHLSCG